VTLPAGKLPVELLRAWLANAPVTDPAVVAGPAIGEDAAVIDTGGPELLVAKTDPITFATENIGSYLLAVNSNDLAAMGAEPRWLLVTALLPEGVEPAHANAIFDDLAGACRSAGISLVGGHTEITVGLTRPILIGCLFGTVRRDRLVRSSGARTGDAVILAGSIAIEGTALLAREHAPELAARGIDTCVIERAAGWLRSPGISVLPAARAIHATGAAHAMHDPTEGGLATGLLELAEAAGTGLRIQAQAIPVLPECRSICDALELNPLGLLASGALIAALDPTEAGPALDRLQAAGIEASVIGEVVERASDCVLVDNDVATPLPVFARDELARYLETQTA